MTLLDRDWSDALKIEGSRVGDAIHHVTTALPTQLAIQEG